MFRYVVDPSDLSVRTKTRAPVVAPEGLLIVEQSDDIDVRDGVYSEKLGKVIEKTEAKKSQEQSRLSEQLAQSETARAAAIEKLATLVSSIPDVATKEALQHLIQILKIN